MTDASHDTSEVAAPNVVSFDLVIRYNADGYVSVASGEAFDDDDSCITDDWEYNAADTSPYRQVRVTVTAPAPVAETFAITLPAFPGLGPLTFTTVEGA